MIKMLPAGYDIRKIPAEVFTSFVEGRIPDMSSLPGDLREYIMNGQRDPAVIISCDFKHLMD